MTSDELAIIACFVLCFTMYFFVLRIVIQLISQLRVLNCVLLEFREQRDEYTRMIETLTKWQDEKEEPDKEHEVVLPDDGLNPWLTP